MKMRVVRFCITLLYCWILFLAPTSPYGLHVTLQYLHAVAGVNSPRLVPTTRLWVVPATLQSDSDRSVAAWDNCTASALHCAYHAGTLSSKKKKSSGFPLHETQPLEQGGTFLSGGLKFHFSRYDRGLLSKKPLLHQKRRPRFFTYPSKLLNIPTAIGHNHSPLGGNSS